MRHHLGVMRSFVALGLANIYLARGVLYEQVRP